MDHTYAMHARIHLALPVTVTVLAFTLLRVSMPSVVSPADN